MYDIAALRVTQAVTNVLDNARRFTRPGGHVVVAMERDGAGGAVVRVTDNGAGIAPELLPHVFESFAQSDHSLARTGGGLGLGLSVARGIIEQHGGTITAASEGTGHGAVLTIELPALPEPAAVSGRAATPRKVAGARVLIVEDNMDAAESLRLILEHTGYLVTVAHSGPDGIAAAKAERPDMVICDIGLPGFDGFTLAERLRDDPNTKHAKLIAVTGYGSDSDRERAVQAGFDVHLVKPVPPDRLLGHLQAA